MEKQTNQEKIDKQLFKKSEVIDGFRYVRWNICLEYAEETKEQSQKGMIKIEDVNKVIENYTMDKEEFYNLCISLEQLNYIRNKLKQSLKELGEK
jgi:hypothetical protein